MTPSLAYKKLCLVEEDWVRASITLEMGGVNITGCYCCPLKLTKHLFMKAGGLSFLIQFNLSTDLNGRHTYSTPWDTKIYDSYCGVNQSGKLVLVEFYSDGDTFSKSVTQSATLYLFLFSNIDE